MGWLCAPAFARLTSVLMRGFLSFGISFSTSGISIFVQIKSKELVVVNVHEVRRALSLYYSRKWMLGEVKIDARTCNCLLAGKYFKFYILWHRETKITFYSLSSFLGNLL